MIVTLQEFLQAVVDALSQITAQISTLSTFFVRTDATTVSLPEDMTLRVGRLIVYDDSGTAVNIFERFNEIEEVWTTTRYQNLKAKIDSMDKKLQNFSLDLNANQPDALRLDATLFVQNLVVGEDLGVLRDVVVIGDVNS